MNPAAIVTAMKLNALRKEFEPKYLKYYQEVKKLPDGTWLYKFQAQFKTEKEAQAFKAFCIEADKLEEQLQ